MELDELRKMKESVEAAARDVLADVPLTASGKPDRPAVAALLRAAEETLPEPPGPAPTRAPRDVRALFERILARPEVSSEASFVSLGADSLSYVELSVRLGELIDPLPTDWHRH